MTIGMVLLAVAAFVLVILADRTAATADRVVSQFQSQEKREYPVAAGETCYRGAFAGLNPGGYVKAFEPGDLFVGVFWEKVDASAETSAGAKNAKVVTLMDFQHALSGVSVASVGLPVFATDDNTLAFLGHPDAFVGRVGNYLSSGQALIRMRGFCEPLADGEVGTIDLKSNFNGLFEATGAGASATKYHQDGFGMANALGLGVLQIGTGGAQLQFDAVAEIASATIYTPEVFAVAQGIRFEATWYMSGIGDAAAIDLDLGVGTALTANSIADIDHADMVNLAALHMDGASANISAQSDDDTTDVANTDTTVDNETDTAKVCVIIVRPAGTVEFWIDGTRVLSTTTFAVGAAAVLSGFVNLEKTSDDTVAVVKLLRLRVAGSRAA